MRPHTLRSGACSQVHLVSAADGAEAAYGSATNAERSEDAAQVQ